MEIRFYIPLIASVLLALIVFWIARRSNFTIQKSAANRLESFASKDQRGFIDRIGDMLIERLGLRLEAWKHALRWAQIGGHYLTSSSKPKSVGSVLGQSVLFAAIGLVYIVLFHAWSPIFWILVALAAYYPYMALTGRADTVRDSVKRGLPEAAAIVAAEMSAGNSITQGLERASSLPGPIGQILSEAVDRSHTEGTLLFSQAGAEGAIVRHFAELRFVPLETFAARMDSVAARGTEGPKRMNELAHDLAMEYQVAVARSAETLDNKLLMPMTIFFFIPFLAAIFIPLMINIFNTF